MGGKSKQSQRTKNNARPSSSGRSAELLNNAVNLESWNSSGGGKMTALFPSLTSPIIDQGLTPEFSLCIKKLNKKDPITKTKALHELTELVNNSKADDVVAALPSWVHFYKILAVDNDCKVRESTQLCHSAVARACGRRLAPALRALVPVWLQTQYDDHAPAQTLSNNSLKATFPENKLPEVISFCKAEVMAHLLENLTGTGDKTIINRIENPEEREVQQTRLAASSLQGLRYFTCHLPPAHHDWLRDQLAPLLAAGAYWRRAHHAEPPVRGAWYSAMGAILERYGASVGPDACSRLARVILSAHAQPGAAHQLWGCVLALMHSVPDWHKWLERKDLFTKKILDMLEQGGWGDAKRLTDMLLPLLANLPQDMLTKQFYEAFFDAFYKGLSKKTVLGSKIERQYWITSLSECLRYLSIQPRDYVVEVATSVHRTWLKKALTVEYESQLRANLIKHSATSMTGIVKFWLKQSKEPNGEKYDQLIRNFWQNVASTVLTQIDQATDPEMVTKVIDGHILLLQTLKSSFTSESKKVQRIKFDGDAPTEAEKVAPTQEIDAVSAERYKHNLNEAVEKVCCGYFEFADKKEMTETVLTPLITILNEFDDKSLYVGLAKHFDASGVYGFYDKVLCRWMLTDTMRCKSVVDVIFILLKHLTEEEQDVALKSFDQFPCGALEWCVAAALSHVHWRAEAVRRWLRCGTVEAALLALARRLLRQRCAHARNLLFVCLSHSSAQEMLISASTAAGVAGEVAAALEAALAAEGGALDLEHAAAVGAHLATALAAAPASDSYAQLVLQLFKLLVMVPRGHRRLTAETWCEVRSAVGDGVQAAPPPALAAAAALLHERLHQLGDAINITEIEHMMSLCPYLLFEPGPAEKAAARAAPLVTSFSQRIIREEDASGAVDVFALRYNCITDDLNCPVDDDNEAIKTIVREAQQEVASELTREHFVNYANKLLFRAIYLKTVLLHSKLEGDDDVSEHNDEEDDDENEDKGSDDEGTKENEESETPVKEESQGVPTMCNEFLKLEYFQEEFCKLVHDYVVVNNLKDAYGFWIHNDLIKQTQSKLAPIIEGIVAATSEELRAEVLSLLSQRSMSAGYYWALAKSCYETLVGRKPAAITSIADNFDVTKVDTLTGNGFFHTLQANAVRLEDETAKLQVKFALMMRCMLLAYGPDESFTAQALAACEACNLEPVISFCRQHQDELLHERSIESVSWQACVAEACVARCTARLLRRAGWEAPAHHWDFATVGLCALFDALKKADPKYASTKVGMIAESACALYEFAEEFISNIRAESERRRPQPHVLQLVSEWRDLFGPVLNRDLYLIGLGLLENASSTISSGLVRTLTAVDSALRRADWRLVDAPHRAHSLALRRLVHACAAALARPLHPAYHCLAFTVLMRVADPLGEYSVEQLNAWSAEGSEEGSARAPPALPERWFRPHLTKAIELADAALTGYTAGVDTCEMAAGSDAHALALGALLLAEALHQLTRRARGDLQHHYIQAYRESQYTEMLLPTALRLIPAELLHLAQQPGNHTPLPAAYSDHFQQIPHYKADDSRWWSSIGRCACRAVSTSVAGAGGAGARGWWGAAGRGARPLARLVAAYVTPALVRTQLHQLNLRKAELEDTEVTIHWSRNEAVMVFSVEERLVQLHVQFEAEFPLSLPRVAAPAARPAVTTSWIAMFIAYQNGTILNAVKMWTAAISSQVESSPQCYVCYCRLHPVTGHLPQLRCHQCQNRFHTNCIHKWFVSSHRSNCPLCRSHF